jgi:hypothetical protein
VDDLQGEWSMSWTEAGEGVSCAWTDVKMSLPDVAKGTVEDGHTAFVPIGSTYRFEGRVTAGEMSGTMSANPFYPEAGKQVETMGSWQAVRAVSP